MKLVPRQQSCSSTLGLQIPSPYRLSRLFFDYYSMPPVVFSGSFLFFRIHYHLAYLKLLSLYMYSCLSNVGELLCVAYIHKLYPYYIVVMPPPREYFGHRKAS
jgi:hypothetical protein